MDKKTYLRRLRRELRPLKREERKRQTEYFDEMISDMVEAGMKEDEAIRKIGDPRATAETILDQLPEKERSEKDRLGLLLSAASALCLCVSMAAFVVSCLGHGFSFYVGGGDGPTNVFLAGKIGQPTWLYGLTALMVGITLVYFWKKRGR